MRDIYVFDMDGVLIDSMERFEKGILSVLDEKGISYKEDLIDIVTPLGYRGTAEYYINKFELRESVENIVKKIEKALYNEYANHIVLKEGVWQYLRKISASNARMFVLTASPHLMTDACLTKNGVYNMFEEIWSVDEFGGLTKSNVELFQVVADRIGCKPEEVHYFDDNLIAIENATKANYDTFAVEDRQAQKVLEKLKRTAKHYVRTFKEL